MCKMLHHLLKLDATTSTLLQAAQWLAADLIGTYVRSLSRGIPLSQGNGLRDATDQRHGTGAHL